MEALNEIMAWLTALAQKCGEMLMDAKNISVIFLFIVLITLRTATEPLPHPILPNDRNLLRFNNIKLLHSPQANPLHQLSNPLNDNLTFIIMQFCCFPPSSLDSQFL